jgi:hypothetical protein
LVVQFLQKNAHRRSEDLKEMSHRLDNSLRKVQPEAGPVRWIAEKTKTGIGGLAILVIGVGEETSKRIDEVLEKYAKTQDLTTWFS